jgi:hypothetical protein
MCNLIQMPQEVSEIKQVDGNDEKKQWIYFMHCMQRAGNKAEERRQSEMWL